jgi:hypothetical protein
MRAFASIALFTLALVLAACGGGGGSRIVPGTTSNAGGSIPNQPSTAKTTHASISLYVPPANKQNARSKPFYISPNTQAFAVYVEAYPSVAPTGLPSPQPSGIQIFPVATPSPCAVASGGGYACTLTVTAPVGTDLFIVAAINGTTLGPGTSPLSAFISGPITVSLSPSPGASPLAFTLNGVVNSVAVAVNSPDPGNTPNTQVFTVGIPASAPVAITAYDGSGNQVMSPATQPFFNPIVIQASPASDGLTLSLIGSSACGSSASGASATIDCAGDLGNVQVTYDGTPRPDPSDHLIDAFSVYSTTAPNPTPSPADFVLQSNIENYTLISGLGPSGSGSFIMRTATGAFVYVVESIDTNEWQLGTFDPGTATSSAPVQLTTANDIVSAALAPNGDVWVDDNGPIDCYTESSGTASPSGLYPVVQPSGDPIWPSAVTVDTTGNLWWVGYDEDNYQMYAGYFSVSAGCGATVPNPIVAQFTLSGDIGSVNGPDVSPNLAPLPSGGVAMATGPDTATGLYIMSTSSGSTITPIAPALAGAFSSYGVAGDNAGNVYAGFWLDPGSPDIEKLASGGSNLSTLLYLPPSPSPPPFPQPGPSGGLNAFSASGPADRLMYGDGNYAALGIVESVQTSPMPILVSLPNASEMLATVYNKNGGEYATNGDVAGNFNLTRALPTRTWSIANTALASGCNGTSALLTVLERGDSGPFTVTIPPADGTAAQFPNADHDFLLSLSNSGPFAVQVTDAHGRTETFTITTASGGSECGIAHRRLKHAPIR